MFGFLLNRRKLSSDPKKLGRWGERYGEKFLKLNGLKLLARNFSTRDGEVDLIMIDRDGSVVFVEVKTRANEKFDSAESAIDYSKKNKLIRTAKMFCRKYEIENRALRFDAVIVILGESGKPEVRHYQNIFSG